MTTSLADHLRSLPDESLAALLQLRPDLVVPVPADFSALALRAQSRVSVARALDGLDQFTLQILDAARLTRDPRPTPPRTEAVLAMATGRPHRIDRRRSGRRWTGCGPCFLLYGPEGELRVAAGVDEVCGPYPAGLGRPAAELDATAGALCADAREAAPDAARRATLGAGDPGPARRRPAGRHRAHRRPARGPRRLRGGPARRPDQRWRADRLAGALAGRPPPAGRDRRRRERRHAGGAAPRGGAAAAPRHRPARAAASRPAAGVSPAREPKAVDSAGAGQAMEVVRHAEALLEKLAADPPRCCAPAASASATCGGWPATPAWTSRPPRCCWRWRTRPGSSARSSCTRRRSPAVRRRTSRCCRPAGTRCGGALSLAHRWDQLARAWLAMTRQAGTGRPAGRPGPADHRALRRGGAGRGAGGPPGGAGGAGRAGARRPRRARRRCWAWWTWRGAAPQPAPGGDAPGGAGRGGDAGGDRAGGADLVRAAAAGRGGRCRRHRAAGRPARAAASSTSGEAGSLRALDALLPAPVDHFLVQADLSVVVPGPPEPELAAELEAVAERESAGGASVHRVTTASVRRALDTGYTAAGPARAVPPPVPHPGPAGADVPDRRRGPQARRAAGRLGRGVRAQRRRGAADRGAGRPAAGVAGAAPAGADGAGDSPPAAPDADRAARGRVRARCRRTPAGRRCWPGRRPAGHRRAARWLAGSSTRWPRRG